MIYFLHGSLCLLSRTFAVVQLFVHENVPGAPNIQQRGQILKDIHHRQVWAALLLCADVERCDKQLFRPSYASLLTGASVALVKPARRLVITQGDAQLYPE